MALLLSAPPREVFGAAIVLVALKISTPPDSLGRGKPVRGGLPPMRQHQSHAHLEGGRRVDSCRTGNPGQDLSVDRFKQKIDRSTHTDRRCTQIKCILVPPPCHRAGADQLFRATRLSEVLKEARRGVEMITSPLFQGDDPPGRHPRMRGREVLMSETAENHYHP